MINIKGQSLVHVGHMLGLMQTWSMTANIGTDPFPKSISFSQPPEALTAPTIHFHYHQDEEPKKEATVLGTIPDIATWLEDLKKHCERLSLRLSCKQLGHVIEDLKENRLTKLAEFGRKAADIVERIEDELGETMLLKVEKKPEMFDAKFPLGEEVASKFPSAFEDSQEAATCLSLERWTACVFHLMRVMEIGVQKFGDRLGVKLTSEKNWQNILDEVNKAIKALDQKADQTKLFASTAAHLYNVKLAWRNEVMHPKATYTEQEAEEIFTNVDAFMKNIVKVV